MKKIDSSNLGNLKITKVKCKSEPKNVVKYFKTDRLLKKYDFRKYFAVNDDSNCLISEKDINAVFDGEFKKVENRIIDAILELAKTCEIDNTLSTNFKVYADGTIKLGYLMREIKENLDRIITEYQEYLASKYNIIEFSFEE